VGSSQKSIIAHHFRRASMEYNYMCAEQRRHMQGFLDEQCAACYPHCDSVCMDGNMKLYTMSNTHEPHRTMYAGFDHGNGIFVPEAEVMKPPLLCRCRATLQLLDVILSPRGMFTLGLISA
jgi:hypothetical protein